jgi:uncharacterized protein
MTSLNNKNLSQNWEQLLNQAYQFFEEGDETHYFLTLKSAAVYHHPEAEFLLGRCFLQGTGVETDRASAVYWFRSAAEHGYLKANAYLASLLLNSEGSEEGKAAARNWLQPAAQKGEPYAQYLLWWMFNQGMEVNPDPVAAMEWLVRSAEQGFALAENQLGVAYCDGRDVQINRDLGISWFTRAASHGDSDAVSNLAWQWHKVSCDETDQAKKREADDQTIFWAEKAAEIGDENARLVLALVKIYGSEELRDFENAIPVLQELAEEGLPFAQSELANCYRMGSGVEKDHHKQFYWLEQAVQGGLSGSADLLGACYRKGLEEFEKDLDKARKWYIKAAEMGSVAALINLGNMAYLHELPGEEEQALSYYQQAVELADSISLKRLAYRGMWLCYANGRGVEKDWEKALFWGVKTAECGNVEDQYELAMNYGYHSPHPDDRQAAYWFEKAALLGHADAQLKLGHFYHAGRGVPRDYEKALHWFRLSAEQGNPHAINNVGDAYYHGLGVEQNYEEAFRWIENAAHFAQKNAMLMMGEMLYNGKGVAQDHKSGLEWIRKAVEAGNQEAQEWLDKNKM